MSKLFSVAKDMYIAARGFHTDRKLLIIESDDWGSIRMPSMAIFQKLQAEGDRPEKDAFLSNDSLESEYDLLQLFDVLNSVHDSKGRPAIMTANFVMANPDFEMIDVEHNRYAFESIKRTYEKYFGENRVLDCIYSGMAKGVFCPQLHCREHLNINRWMRDLKNKKEDVEKAFRYHMIGIGASFAPDNIYGYMDAFNTDCTETEQLKRILADAVSMFKKVFGYESSTFVASCFVWDDSLESYLKELGIRSIQAAPWQYVPNGKNEYSLRRRLHFTGEKSKSGLFYTVRNCSYEPAYNQNPEECVELCLTEISRSFLARKPAIITSHRLNYISSINPQNADRNLKGLRYLLQRIIAEFPDVEFISSSELSQYMSERSM